MLHEEEVCVRNIQHREPSLTATLANDEHLGGDAVRVIPLKMSEPLATLHVTHPHLVWYDIVVGVPRGVFRARGN